MTSALRTTLSMVLAVLACCFVPAASAGATGAVSAGPTAECPPLALTDPAAVRTNTAEIQKRADAVTDVFAGRVRTVRPRQTVGGGEGRANQNGTAAPSQKPDARTTAFEHQVQVKNPFRSSRQPGEMVLVVTRPTPDGGLGRLQEDATYLFFVTDKKGADVVAEPCSGTQLLRPYTADLRDALETALDEPEEETMPDYALTAPDDGTRAMPSLSRLAAPGVAVVLIGVLGLLLLARVGRRRT